MFSLFRINNEYHEPLCYFDLIELDEKQQPIFHMTKRVAWKYLKLIDSLQYNGRHFEAIEDTSIANQIKRTLEKH